MLNRRVVAGTAAIVVSLAGACSATLSPTDGALSDGSRLGVEVGRTALYPAPVDNCFPLHDSFERMGEIEGFAAREAVVGAPAFGATRDGVVVSGDSAETLDWLSREEARLVMTGDPNHTLSLRVDVVVEPTGDDYEVTLVRNTRPLVDPVAGLDTDVDAEDARDLRDGCLGTLIGRTPSDVGPVFLVVNGQPPGVVSKDGVAAAPGTQTWVYLGDRPLNWLQGS